MSESDTNPLRALLREIRDRSLLQVLGVYVVSGWIVFEVVQSLTEGLGLPSWFPAFTFVALLVGLPIVLATAFVQHGAAGRSLPPGVGTTIEEVYPSSHGLGSTPGRRIFTWTNTAVGGVAVLLVGSLAAVFMGNGNAEQTDPGGVPPTSVPAVVEGAEVIAVFPFRTSGPELEHLREGLMDLLSQGLAQSDVIRTVSPRTVMRTLGGAASAEMTDVDVEEALALSSDMGSTSVLLGSAVAVGGQVRLDAVLYHADGDSLVTVQATGEPGDLLALVDELAVSVVRGLWRSNAPIPNLNAAAVTTRSPQALRAFLEGERLYRSWDIASARAALAEAVRIDSTFALAYHRLGWAWAFTEGPSSPNTIAPIRMADRYAERLPRRERTLVDGFLHFVEGRLEEGHALMAPYVERWPDDAEAWMLMAQYVYHHPEWMGRSADEVLTLFDRAIASDSTFTAAYTHPLWIALHHRDHALYQRYMEPLRRFGVADRFQRIIDQAARCFGGPGDEPPPPLPESEWLTGEPSGPFACAG